VKGVAGWLFQRITGILLIAGLILHFVIMHFSGSQEITYAFVVKRLSNPWWKTFDIAFLLTAIFHGYNGFRGLALEYVSSEPLLRLSQAVILLFAAALTFAGIYIVSL
jgi:succinate dehydrogenase / fumarate reductase membrane anchor subunit